MMEASSDNLNEHATAHACCERDAITPHMHIDTDLTAEQDYKRLSSDPD